MEGNVRILFRFFDEDFYKKNVDDVGVDLKGPTKLIIQENRMKQSVFLKEVLFV